MLRNTPWSIGRRKRSFSANLRGQEGGSCYEIPGFHRGVCVWGGFYEVFNREHLLHYLSVSLG